MKQPCLICIFACAALCLSSVRATAQGNPSTPRTADGHPDLSGVWNGNAASPFAKSEDPLSLSLCEHCFDAMQNHREPVISVHVRPRPQRRSTV